MSNLFPVLIALAALWFVWRFVSRLFQPSQPAEPAETEPIDDPYAPVPSPRRTPPKGRSGAVALEEPGDDSPADCYPPRGI